MVNGVKVHRCLLTLSLAVKQRVGNNAASEGYFSRIKVCSLTGSRGGMIAGRVKRSGAAACEPAAAAG